MDLAEAMALAVLKGDRVAAYALADKLTEERLRDGDILTGYSDRRAGHISGYEVYHWPEFQALAKKLGIFYDLRTVSMTITLPVEGNVEIVQSYLGTNNG